MNKSKSMAMFEMNEIGALNFKDTRDGKDLVGRTKKTKAGHMGDAREKKQ